MTETPPAKADTSTAATAGLLLAFEQVSKHSPLTLSSYLKTSLFGSVVRTAMFGATLCFAAYASGSGIMNKKYVPAVLCAAGGAAAAFMTRSFAIHAGRAHKYMKMTETMADAAVLKEMRADAAPSLTIYKAHTQPARPNAPE